VVYVAIARQAAILLTACGVCCALSNSDSASNGVHIFVISPRHEQLLSTTDNE
jgi:hypothetical protein